MWNHGYYYEDDYMMYPALSKDCSASCNRYDKCFGFGAATKEEICWNKIPKTLYQSNNYNTALKSSDARYLILIKVFPTV